ncbi:polyprenyl synthetase family protein [Streptomyces anulatus]|uniref:polyprenyl synthetase family protein n=1 Tax=Streptomyces anulatus TaxID=1892 RepID=UPI0012FF50F8|nr:polyprenyl synthetase family protein [Streptomyces anulatus]
MRPNHVPNREDLSRVQGRLQEDLARVRESLRSLVIPSQGRISEPIRYAVEKPGRMLRPTLVLLSSYLLEDLPEGVRDTVAQQRVIEAAAVVETLHIATLCHDDLIDGATLRRGRPSTNAVYGDALALLAGDYLLARCMQVAASLDVTRVQVMADTLIDVCVGQMLESSQLHDAQRTEEDYLAAVSGKTARLLRTAAGMGALRSEASDDARAALERFGHHLGMAFQIWDDILDICSEETGKQQAKDIMNGVYTLPVIYAVKDVPDLVLPLLRDLPISDEQCRRIVAVVRECGAIDRAAELAQRHISDALHAVETHPATMRRAPVVRQCLRDLIDVFATQHPALHVLPTAP